jgi:5-oxoprolinase (ATP-hydrolysing) subunit C
LITVLKPGLQASVQDLGRPGLRHLGVGLSGAMDRLSLAVGNYVVGNPPDAAGLELTMPPARIRFESACAIALTGADCTAHLDEVPAGRGRRIPVRAGQTLDITAARAGIHAYVCVSGGIDVPPVLGSRSTDLQAGLGGLDGRPLRPGDTLKICTMPAAPAQAKAAARSDPDQGAAAHVAVLLPEMKGVIRVMRGPEFDEFDVAARDALMQSLWTVTPQSNRMGYRLLGAALLRRTTRQLNSHAVFPGVIQVPDGGAPIVLMADAQATGGYPKIATVIAADLWRLAQVRPGNTIEFELVTRAQAHLAWQKQQQYLMRLQEGLNAH